MEHLVAMAVRPIFITMLALTTVAPGSAVAGDDLHHWVDARARSVANKGSDLDIRNAYLLEGFVRAVIEGQQGTSFCVPHGSTFGQSLAVVEQYVRANPAEWHRRKYWLVTSALAKAFPCAKR